MFSIVNSAQGDFSFAFRRTHRDPPCPFGVQGGLLVENTRRRAVVGPCEPRSDARAETSGVCQNGVVADR